MTDKEKYDALAEMLVKRCAELDLKSREADCNNDFDAAVSYWYQHKALYDIIIQSRDLHIAYCDCRFGKREVTANGQVSGIQ